jgi:hypothetical protein
LEAHPLEKRWMCEGRIPHQAEGGLHVFNSVTCPSIAGRADDSAAFYEKCISVFHMHVLIKGWRTENTCIVEVGKLLKHGSLAVYFILLNFFH